MNTSRTDMCIKSKYRVRTLCLHAGIYELCFTNVISVSQVYLNFSEMQLVNSSATVTCYNSLNENMTAILATFR